MSNTLRKYRLTVVATFLLTSFLTAGFRADAIETGLYVENDLPELSLQDLLELEVTSSTRKVQKLSDAAAAVFVITQEDIRRSGATSIPEVLRMVPGLLVARIDSNTWAISSRSFNSRFANKLLVLVDGRSVFNNLIPSVFWETLDTVLADIDRIEVVRGPAATLWGANAVNGVINIVTKQARHTQGTLLDAGTGTEERGFASLRHGGRSGPDTYWKVYGKYTQRDSSKGTSGRDAVDDWEMARGGFRMDWMPEGPETLTVQGDVYYGREGVSGLAFGESSALPVMVEEDAQLAGANLLSRWRLRFSERSKGALQLYYDWTKRGETILGEERQTLDLDAQHLFSWGTRQQVLWGGGWRYSLSDFDNSLTFSFPSSRRTEHTYNLFLQDEIDLLSEQLALTLGARLEHNSYTDFELHSNARLLWTPTDNVSFWGAVSRASRTPGRFDREARVVVASAVGTMPIVGNLSGDRDFDAEEVTAFEVGLRLYPLQGAGFDLTAFYNDYDRVRSFDLGSPSLADVPPPLHIVQPLTVGNNLEGETYGVELAADWRPLQVLNLKLAYTFSRGNFRNRQTSGDLTAEIEEEKIPRHQVSFRSALDLPKNLEMDLWLRYVDNVRRGDIPSYLGMDARLAWKPRRNLELCLVGQNLLDSHHPEFPRETLFSVFPTQVERGLYGKVLWHF